MDKNGKIKIELLTEFLNISQQISECMKTKCKIIDNKINKNPMYKEYISKILSSKSDEELVQIIDNIMSVAEYPDYTSCQFENCNINIKNLVIILLKLYNYYKTKENKKFPSFVETSITSLNDAISSNQSLFNKYDREINILLSYINKI
jgi:hypothetical protein